MTRKRYRIGLCIFAFNSVWAALCLLHGEILLCLWCLGFAYVLHRFLAWREKSGDIDDEPQP